ncbi:MAG: electron transfer flavoprotein subunit beta/FixA family protein [Spirochaetota bacterium]
MNVLTCFAPSPDLEMLAEEDWVVEHNQVDLSFVKRELNCYDESALELSLRLAEQASSLQHGCTLTALHVGNREVEPFMRKLYALRFDRAVCIETADDLRFSPNTVAEMIAAYANDNPQDVIVTGSQSSIGGNSQTPLLLAEHLGIPCITQVTAMEAAPDGRVHVVSQLDDGFLRQTVSPPCLLAVGNAPNSYLRVPTLKDKMNFGKQPVNYIKPAVNTPKELKRSVSLQSMRRREQTRNTVVIEEGTPEEMAKRLYEQYLKEQLG